MRAIAMDEARMNHYEKQLYTVFKTFDVDNEESLDREAVLQLCDALQLEARGAALADSLFERRAERVTFASFRNGLLSVLGASPPAPGPPAPAPGPPAPTAAPAHSDDDSSGCEVAPKFVFGSKKYGRRSRPARGGDETPAPRAASASRADADADEARHPRMRYKRSASAMEGRAGDAPRLDHDRRIDRAQAAALCRDLRMDGIDPRLLDRIFDDAPDDETTVGEFFDRLNAALTCIATTGDGSPSSPDLAAPPDDDDEAEGAVPGEAVAEAWELAGVRRPRRLLAELGFTSAALRPRELERALDEELRALGPPPDEPPDARPLLQTAALATSRLRLGRSRARAAAAAAERDKLRADLAEANRRAQLLAQDVDENHARLEAERQAALRQLEAKHAEAARVAADEWAAERERAAAARALLEQDAARRLDAETRLRAELAALSVRAEHLEKRAVTAEERAAGAERERARAEDELRAAAARDERAAQRERAEAGALAEQLRALREDNARLRDRADELHAALEARAAPGPAPPAADTSWRDEAELEPDAPLTPDRIEDCDSAPASIEQKVVSHVEASRRLRALGEQLAGAAGGCARCGAAVAALRELGGALILHAPAPGADAAAQTAPAPTDEADALRARINDLTEKHEVEKADLNNLVTELESALEALRLEYERCEEYWARKLADERAAAADDAAAADERLAELLRRVADYERAFRPRLPALLESALEPQYHQLAQEFDEFKASAAQELAATREEAARELAAAREQAAREQAGPRAACCCAQEATEPAPARTASDDERRSAHEHVGDGDGAQRSMLAGAPPPAPPAPPGALAAGGRHTQLRRQAPPGPSCGGCGCAALWAGWSRRAGAGAGAGAGAEAGALRARAAHAERAAARLLARLHAADALVADLYRENCSLQHRAAPRLL